MGNAWKQRRFNQSPLIREEFNKLDDDVHEHFIQREIDQYFDEFNDDDLDKWFNRYTANHKISKTRRSSWFEHRGYQTPTAIFVMECLKYVKVNLWDDLTPSDRIRLEETLTHLEKLGEHKEHTNRAK